MMRLHVLTKIGLLSALALSGCQTIGGGAGTPGGQSQAVSGMTRGLISGPLGKGLSAADRKTALASEYRALEYTQGGKPVSWTGAKGDVSGDVVAAQPYRVGSQDCRQYTHTVFVGGAARNARGTACRNADGSWDPLT